MGTTNALGMAEAVTEGLASLDAALHYHLQANHFPPVDPSFIPAAKEAIGRAEAEEWDTVIELPNGRSVTVSSVIEGLHLDAFLHLGETDDDPNDDDYYDHEVDDLLVDVDPDDDRSFELRGDR